MIDSSAAAPPLLLQLVLQQQTKLTGINVVVATKEALKMKKLEQNDAQASKLARLHRLHASYRRRRPIARP